MSSDEKKALIVFPQSVHESLAELRAIAKRAKSRNEPGLRWATDDERALAETLRKPWHCTGHSGRTGLACTQARILGMTVCRKHGGAQRDVIANAERRLRKMITPSLAAIDECRTQDKHLPTKLKAAQDVLDRVGVGALVEAKVRASQEDANRAIHVTIGFLSTSPQQPSGVVVEVPHRLESADDPT